MNFNIYTNFINKLGNQYISLKIYDYLGKKIPCYAPQNQWSKKSSETTYELIFEKDANTLKNFNLLKTSQQNNPSVSMQYFF